MLDDTVTTRWRRLTDQAKVLWSESVDDPFAATPWALPRRTRGAVAVENLPAAPAVVPHPDLVSLTEGAAYSLPPARDGEAVQRTAQLAAWEDEGGTTSS